MDSVFLEEDFVASDELESESRMVGFDDARLRRKRCLSSPQKKILAVGLFLGFILVVAGFAAGIGTSDSSSSPNQPVQPDDTGIVSPPNDEKRYRYVTLPNDLKVVLVSDKETDKASAALSVRVGSWSDTSAAYGLAHFCEHMLFMGSVPFPDENEYSEWISAKGGGDNAYTADRETNYFFDVRWEFFNGTLARFAPFFISPLLKKDAVFREMQAVDNEHSKNLLNDGWRFSQLQKSLSDPSFPFYNFGTGSLATLNHSSIHQELLDYYNKSYSANLMTLVLYGREDLDTLETMAKMHFGSIPNKQVTEPKWKGSPYPAGTQYTKRFVNVVSIEKLHRLTIFWAIEPIEQAYRSSPDSYLSHLLGHEAEGGILYWLKRKEWATSLYAGADESSASFATFSIEIQLTDEGLKHTDSVIAGVMAYVKLVDQKGTGDEKWWTENLKMHEISFQFSQKTEAIEFTQNSASNLHTIPPKYMLFPPEMREWDPALIKKILAEFIPDRMVVQLSSNSFEGKLVNPQTEKWYGTQYTVEPITAVQVGLWNTPPSDTNFHLPLENKYIPSNFTLFPPGTQNPSKPKLLRNTSQSQVWHSLDVSWKQPVALLHFAIRSPVVFTTATNQVLTDIFCSLVHEMLASEAYYLVLANAGFSVARSSTGLTVSISAYSQKVHIVLDSLIKAIKSLISGAKPVDVTTFALVKTAMLQGLRNFQSAQPYQSGFAFIHAYLSSHNFLPQEKIPITQNVTSEALAQFVPQIFAGATVESLGYGNIDEAMVLKCTDQVLELISDSAAPVDPTTREKLVKVEKPAVFQSKAYNSEPNSAVVAYFQVEKRTDHRTKVLSYLFGKFVREPFFDQLRTKETLGYTVSAWATTMIDVSILAFLVQGTKKPANEQEMRIEAFLASLGTPGGKLLNMTTDTFNQLKSTVKADYQQRYLSLSEAAAPVWSVIDEERYEFGWRAQNIATLEAITRDDLVAFYKDYLQVGGKFRRKFSCEMFGKDHTISPPTGDGFADSTVLNDFSTRDQWQKNQSQF